MRREEPRGVPVTGGLDLAAIERQLAETGASLRRGEAAPKAAVSAAELQAWFERRDVSAVRADLHRAAEAAVELVLSDDAAERGEWERWAKEALASRDLFDCALLACAGLDDTLTDACRAVRDRVARELAHLDTQTRSLARWLVGLNTVRREARSHIAPEHRERVWWYCARADCDDLVALWREPDLGRAPTPHCEDCARDLQNARGAERPPGGCVTADELWAMDAGELVAPRRRLVERHARGCPECALALQALAVSLDEAPETAPELSRAAAPEVLVSRPDFQVLLFRGPRRLRVVAGPGERLVAAALHGQTAMAQAKVVAGGLELSVGELGPRPLLRVELPDGRAVEVTLDL